MMQGRLAACRIVHRAHSAFLLGHRDVVATGVGIRSRNGAPTGEHVVKLFVTAKRPRDALTRADLLPATLRYGADEVTIDIEVLEPPRVPAASPHLHTPRPADPQLSVSRRPVSGGLSIAHWDFPIGTVAVGVQDLVAGRLCVLSCNHVLARMNAGWFGDAVLQPASDDGGWFPGRAVAALLRYVPVCFDGGSNQIDAAIAACWPGEVSGHVHGLGAIHESAAPWTLSPGDVVRKVGRSTGLTDGKVLFTDVTVKADYTPLGLPSGKAWFTDQIVVDVPAAYGDSGSLLVDGNDRAVGMLFGGTAHHTWFNPFRSIEQQLHIRLLPRRHAWL